MSKLPVGIQVYGLRDLLMENPAESFKPVMTKVKELGYDGIELAGLYGLEPAFVRSVLDEVGLVAISAHVPLAEMKEDINKVIADYKTIGVQYIVVPYMPEEVRPLTPGYKGLIEDMKAYGKAVTEAGLTLLYHNHDFEFVKLEDGTFGFDDIYTQIPEDILKVEPDTCWITVAGQKAASYIKKYGNRCEIVHLKDFIKEGQVKNMYELIGIENDKEEEEEEGVFEFRAVGFGQMIWEPILKETLDAGAKWVIVEQDQHYDLCPLECARRSREYLRILGW